jgi:flagellar basal body-associated protein FliL
VDSGLSGKAISYFNYETEKMGSATTNEVSKPEEQTTTAQTIKKKSMIQNIFSLSTLSSLMAAFYVYFAFSNLVNLMYPLRNIPQDVLQSYGKDRMVFPFWNWDEKSSVGRAELGLRVYLSTQEHFSVNFFQSNDEFEEKTQDGDGSKIDQPDEGFKRVDRGNSFLLWSEDNTFEATKSFHSRSFVIVASDDACEAGTCSSKQQNSIEFAHQWIKNSIQHEKQLQSDGGGLISAMNSAGGGIESTSVLLALYTSVQRNMKHMLEYFISGSDASSSEKTDREEEEEPKSTIYISPQNPIWKSLMSNGTAYVHVLLVRQKASTQSSKQHLISSSPNAHAASQRLQQLHSHHNVLFGRVDMTKRELPLHVPSPKRLLYKDILFCVQKYGMCPLSRGRDCNSMVPPWNVAHHQPKEFEEYSLARQHKQQGVKYPYWKPEVHIHLIQEEEGYPLDFANHLGFEIVQVGRPGLVQHPSGYSYLPAVHVDEIGLTSDKYIPLNKTVSALPLRVGFHSGMDIAEDGNVQHQQGLTPARYRLLNHLSSSLESQAELGFEQSDIDDLRRLIAETNVMLLAITILASVLHLLFEFLTFKSDVDFWRGNTDLTGLSVRALFLDWMSQVIILLYLIEMDSSLLMTVPTGVGMLIALWKCQRGAGFKLIKSTGKNKSWYNKMIFGLFGYELSATRLRASSNNEKSSAKDSSKPDLAALTEEMDQLATNLLGKYFLIPLVVSYAIYSLAKEYHAGWYSWFITTASSFVYAIGFVLMTPQLFLNYKLKSVAHLPWRVLGYKFVNTFIDDLFAFIIRMPTMARMSCFRDDVVFIIYLWQRYLYPVDTSRPVEGGGEIEVQSNKEEKKGKKKQS